MTHEENLKLAQIALDILNRSQRKVIKIDPHNRNAEGRVAGRPGDERRDCVVRAFTIATGKPYSEIHALFKKHGRKSGRGTMRSVTVKVAAELGMKWTARRCTAAKFLDEMEHAQPVAAFIRGHAFAVEKGAVVDIMDPIKPRCIVTGFYSMPR